jgi:hypothetical protein
MNSKIPEKYQVTVLPSKEQALLMAAFREEWARLARERDQLGSAKEFELMALLLRYYATDDDDAT